MNSLRFNNFSVMSVDCFLPSLIMCHFSGPNNIMSGMFPGDKSRTPQLITDIIFTPFFQDFAILAF